MYKFASCLILVLFISPIRLAGSFREQPDANRLQTTTTRIYSRFPLSIRQKWLIHQLRCSIRAFIDWHTIVTTRQPEQCPPHRCINVVADRSHGAVTEYSEEASRMSRTKTLIDT